MPSTARGGSKVPRGSHRTLAAVSLKTGGGAGSLQGARIRLNRRPFNFFLSIVRFKELGLDRRGINVKGLSDSDVPFEGGLRTSGRENGSKRLPADAKATVSLFDEKAILLVRGGSKFWMLGKNDPTKGFSVAATLNLGKIFISADVDAEMLASGVRETQFFVLFVFVSVGNDGLVEERGSSPSDALELYVEPGVEFITFHSELIR